MVLTPFQAIEQTRGEGACTIEIEKIQRMALNIPRHQRCFNKMLEKAFQSGCRF